jgi:hypothetical protein
MFSYTAVIYRKNTHTNKQTNYEKKLYTYNFVPGQTDLDNNYSLSVAAALTKLI